MSTRTKQSIVAANAPATPLPSIPAPFQSCAEPVTGPAQCVNQLDVEPVVDLSAETPDEHLEHVGERIVVVVPHVRGDRRPIDDASAVTHQTLEEREFFRC